MENAKESCEAGTIQGNIGEVKISMWEKLCYGFGDTACNIVVALTATMLTFFYTDYIGVSAGTVGMIMLISRVFDGGFGRCHGADYRPDTFAVGEGKALGIVDECSICHIYGAVVHDPGRRLGYDEGRLHIRYL